MKAALFFLMMLFVSLEAYITEDEATARRLSKEHQLPITLVATGSDWSDASQRCIREFLLKEQCQNLSKSSVILWLDFPELSTKPFKQVADHYALQETFQLEFFPVFILLDLEGNEVTRLSYPISTVGDFAAYIKEKWYGYCDLKEKWAAVKESKEEALLLTCLEKAEEIGCMTFADEIKNWAISERIGKPILVDHYVELVQRGLEKTDAGIALKQFLGSQEEIAHRIHLVNEIATTSPEESPLEFHTKSAME